MNHPPDRCATPRRAFTLLEMLLVMTIIVLIVSFVVPATVGILRGSAMTQGAQLALAQFTLAQTTALSTNQTTQLRFYYCDDPNGANPNSTANQSSWRMRGMQIYALSPQGTYTALGKVTWLPTGVVMDAKLTAGTPPSVSDDPLSSLFYVNPLPGTSTPDGPTKTGTYLAPGAGYPSLPRVGTNYICFAVNFRPDGSTSLNPTFTWFVTLHSLVYPDGGSTPPADYFTIALDPVQGTTRVYRPL